MCCLGAQVANPFYRIGERPYSIFDSIPASFAPRRCAQVSASWACLDKRQKASLDGSVQGLRPLCSLSRLQEASMFIFVGI